MTTRLRDGRENLRGAEVIVVLEGRARWVTVVTHIRGDRWRVEGRRGKRAIVRERDMTFVDGRA
jgi:hypothetical protein